MHHHQRLKQHPFSIYDFLAYLIPGTILIASIIFMDLYLFENCCGIYDFLNDSSSIESGKKSFRFPSYISGIVADIFFSSFLIFFLYVIGQMLGILSSYIIEKGYYVKKYGYPGEYLLHKIDNRKGKKDKN